MSSTLDYLHSKPESELSYPFGPDVGVFKIRNRMFATHSINSEQQENINLKCDPDQALALRDIFNDIIPGYHMNKRHWNTVIIGGDVPSKEVERLIDLSYRLVVDKLSKRERDALHSLYRHELDA